MKKILLSLMAVFALTANAADTVTSLTFDNAESPALTAGTNATLDYTHAGVVGAAGNFLNIWGANNTNGATNIPITSTDMTQYAEWTLEFDFCGYGGCNKKTGTAKLLDSNGTALFTITDAANWNNTMTVSDGNTIVCCPCNKSTRISANTGNDMTADKWYHITVVGAKGGVKLTAAQYNADGTLKDAAISKSVLTTTNASPATLAIAPGSCGAMGVDNLVLTGNNDVAQSYAYTVKYVCDGVEIKTAVTSQDPEGTPITLSAADKAPVYVGADKYIYVSDDSEGKVVTKDGATVVTVTFRKAEIFKYSIVSSLGGAVVTGSNFEGESITTGYPHYQLVEGQLNVAAANNKEYNTTFVLDQNNKEVVITYAESKQNVVYYSEAEDIEGLTVTTYGNIGIRASKSLAAVAKTNTKITNLPAGMYIISGGLFSSAKTPDYDVKLTAGKNNITLHNNTVNASEVASTEITLTKATDLVLLAEGMGDNNALDYLYIQKTGEVEADKVETVTYDVNAKITVPTKEASCSQKIKVEWNMTRNTCDVTLPSTTIGSWTMAETVIYDVPFTLSEGTYSVKFPAAEIKFSNATESVVATVNAETSTAAIANGALTAEINATSSMGDIKVVYGTSCDLTKEMFHRWSSPAHGSEIKEDVQKPWCDYVIGESTGMPYGNGNVDEYEYADLTEYSKLVITTTAGTPRALFNRDVANGQAPDHLIDCGNNASQRAAYMTEKDGVFTIDIAEIVSDKGYAHLHCIKGAQWANVTVTSMVLLKDVKTPTPVTPTGISTVKAEAPVKAKKFFQNGQIIIMKNGQKFNVAGQAL